MSSHKRNCFMRSRGMTFSTNFKFVKIAGSWDKWCRWLEEGSPPLLPRENTRRLIAREQPSLIRLQIFCEIFLWRFSIKYKKKGGFVDWKKSQLKCKKGSNFSKIFSTMIFRDSKLRYLRNYFPECLAQKHLWWSFREIEALSICDRIVEKDLSQLGPGQPSAGRA